MAENQLFFIEAWFASCIILGCERSLHKEVRMPSKLTLSDHPLHPMLTGFPILFYAASFISFVTYYINGNIFWFQLAYTAAVAGALTALIILVPALSELSIAPRTRNKQAHRSGSVHLSLEFAAMILFSFAIWLHADKWDLIMPDVASAIPITGMGLGLSFLAGFFGWDLGRGFIVRSEGHRIGEELPRQKRQRLKPSYQGHVTRF